jgi:hypothetical protein
MNRVVHCKREPFDIYIGRPSPWGNPFIVGRDGDRVECVLRHSAFILGPEGGYLREHVVELAGHTLGCWCHPRPCHGDILAKLAQEAYDRGERPAAGPTVYMEWLNRPESKRWAVHLPVHKPQKTVRLIGTSSFAAAVARVAPIGYSLVPPAFGPMSGRIMQGPDVVSSTTVYLLKGDDGAWFKQLVESYGGRCYDRE